MLLRPPYLFNKPARAEINWGHSLARSLVFCGPFGPNLTNLYNQTSPDRIGSNAIRSYPSSRFSHGAGTDSTTSTAIRYAYYDALAKSGGEFTICVWFDSRSMPGYATLFGIPHATDNSWASPYWRLGFYRVDATTSADIFATTTGFSTANSGTGYVQTAQANQFLAVTNTAANAHTFYLDGRVFASGAASLAGLTITSSHDGPTLVSNPADETTTGSVALALLYYRTLAAEEIAALASAPLQMIRALPRMFSFPVNVIGGGGTSYDVALTLAASRAASLSATANRAGVFTLAASKALTDSGTKTTNPSLTLAATKALSDSGAKITTSALTLAVTKALSDNASKGTSGQLTLAATKALSSNGSKSTASTLTLSVTRALSDSGAKVTNSALLLSSTRALSTAGGFTAAAALTIAATKALATAGSRAANGALTLAATKALSVAKSAIYRPTLTLAAVRSLSVAGAARFSSALSLATTKAISLNRSIVASRSVALAASKALSSSATKGVSAALTLAASKNLTTSVLARFSRSLTLAVTKSLLTDSEGGSSEIAYGPSNRFLLVSADLANRLVTVNPQIDIVTISANTALVKIAPTGDDLIKL